jgi:hypothetical protein
MNRLGGIVFALTRGVDSRSGRRMADDDLTQDAGSSGNAPPATTHTTRAAIRYRDGGMVLTAALQREKVQLRRAGFCPYPLTLERHDGSCVQSELWMQDEPHLADYLNAANLLFGDEPGSIRWSPARAAAARPKA